LDPTPSQLSPDRKLFAVEEGLVDARTFRPLRTVRWSGSAVTFAFSPDSRVLATVAGDYDAGGVLELWGVREGRLLRTIASPESGVTAAAFTPTGNLIATSERDGALQLWQAGSGRLVAMLQVLSWGWEGEIAVNWIAYTPEGYYAGSPGVEQFIRWRLGGQLLPARQYSGVFHRPGLVGRALRGERLPAPALMPLSRSGSWFRSSSGSQR
jgi:WD40 repeat protein